MTIRAARCLGALLFFVASTSFSASVELRPQSVLVAKGGTLVIDLFMNAPDEIVSGTNASTGAIGGAVILSSSAGATQTAFELVLPAVPATPPFGSPAGSEAFETAERNFPNYCRSSDFRLRFLRTDNFHSKKAAGRMIRYFDFKKFLFGNEKLGTKISLEELHPEDIAFLKRGFMQILPSRDRGK